MNIRLFIENNELDLDNEVQVAITKQFEDITNPTTIINDWSKTVEIPFSQNNNNIFGHIYNPDKINIDGGDIGVYFNPLKKLNFRLQDSDNVIMTGYCKLNEVKQVGGRGTYSLTLFGELGRIFSEMKKITFDETTEDTNYLIDGSEYVDEYINKELIYNSWTSTGQSSPNLTGDFTNYIGFAPNNSFNEEFDYKTWQKGELESDTFENTLNLHSFTEITGVQPSTAIPNGLLPREIGEYRSYFQLPYIYFNKLFKIFQEKAEDITGYKFNLSSNWFNTSNPYWYDLVYMLKRLDSANGDSYNNFYSNITGYDSVGGSSYLLVRWDLNDFTLEHNKRLFTNNVITEQIPILTHETRVNRINITDNNLVTILNYKLNTFFYTPTSGVRIKPNNGLLVTVIIQGENNITESKEYLIIDENSTLTYNDATVIKTGTSSTTQLDVPLIDVYFSLMKEKFGNYVETSCKVRWLVDSYPFTGAVQGTSYYYLNYTDNPCLLNAKISGKHWARSNAKITLNTLWNYNYNLFNEILNYCKMYRIGVFINEYDRIISFIPLSEYFSNYTIEDWTDRIDKSKDYNIKPITFKNKYVLFNYEDNNTKLGKQYLDKYGANYGEKRLITDYNFNDDVEKLFNDIKTSINNTDNVLSWTNLFDNTTIIYSFPSEISVYNKDANNKNVDTFGRYYFFRGLANFDTNLQLRNVSISDDTAFQQYNDKYFYSQQFSELNVTTYPYLSVVKGNNMCLFNIPMENYTYISNEYNGSNDIYNQFWDNYIKERYNIDNKIVTCYLKILPNEYESFEFNKFITIGNQLYMINKIYDYDVTSNDTTKVDLITIQDIKGYTTNNYNYGND